MTIKVIIEKTKTGYSAYADKYRVFTVGGSLKKLRANMLEALNLYFEKDCKTVSENNLNCILK